MAKRSTSSGHQSFSFRRLFFHRTRQNDNQRTPRITDVEAGHNINQDSTGNVKINNNADITNCGSIRFFNLTEAQPAVDLDDQQHQENCVICFLKESSFNPFFTLETCTHKFCISCLVKYLKNEINESRTDIACPQCSSGIHPNNIDTLLKDCLEYKRKYEDFMIRRYLVTDPDSRWCPAPDCSYAVIATGCASCPQITCKMPNCGVSFCYHCKAEWHPDKTCDAARLTRQIPRSPSISLDSSRRDEIKPCPRCQVLIVKMNDGSCNHMVCSVCGAEFCWLCLKEVSDLHYLSPSGCTFWGKKPWSRKKKIVWQIGTLIGAPVGIALLAGIAIPSMVIGIPVWVGRKLLVRYKSKTKKKRNICVSIGVTASILISPILAGLAIAIGVPILLFYVYGIVPVSLCRSGCGSSTGNENEFNFDVNPSTTSNDDKTTTRNNFDGSSSIDAVSRIGETSIGDVSFSAASGSLIDSVGESPIAIARNNLNNVHRESTLALAGSLRNHRLSR